MDRLLRRATLWVLVAMAFAVWFERSIFGEDRGVLRVVVGVLCIYVALHSLERQRLELAFRHVLGALKQFRCGAAGGGVAGAASSPVPSPDEGTDALRILIEAVRRGGAAAPVAVENLRRLTGEDFGLDPGAWEAWLRARRPGS